MAPDKKFTLPPDYTFWEVGGILMHKTVLEKVRMYMKESNERDPDLHDMYIYNDFYGYAVLDLVDRALSSIHTFVTKKKWKMAWHNITALSIFLDFGGDVIITVDDGDRVAVTDKAFGALVVATLRALEAAGQLNEETIPDLEASLQRLAVWSKDVCVDLDNVYAAVILGYGKKLFGSRTQEEREQRREWVKAAYVEFVKGLSKEEREKWGYRLPSEQGGTEGQDGDEDDDEDEEDEEEGDKKDKGPWYGDAKAEDASKKDPSYKVTPVWREYKNWIADEPQIPLRGPPAWNISKWSAQEKKEFSFGNEVDDDDDM